MIIVDIILYLEQKRQMKFREIKQRYEDQGKTNNIKEQVETEINEIQIKTFNKDDKKKEVWLVFK